MTDKDRILIIDDDNLMAQLVNLYLAKAGFEVFVAHSGREGLQEVDQHHPDLIVLDITMPEMDGWEVCSRIRQIDDIPIIMLTARGQESDKARGLKMGANDYMLKPFSLRELEARIGAVLRGSRLSAPSTGHLLHADEELVSDSDKLEVDVPGSRLPILS